MTDGPIIEYPLSLAPAASQIRPPVAWFIPGDQPAAWLQEMTAWSVSLLRARLFVLPKSAADNRPSGVLVVTPESPAGICRALPYGRIGDRLYLPADARLDPDATADELARCLRLDAYVLHPSAGLIGFGEGDALTAADLLAPPPRRPADWNHGHPGARLNDQLRSVQAEALPTLQQFIQMSRDDIGTETEEHVPDSPRETPKWNAVKAALEKAAMPLMSALSKLLSAEKPAMPANPAKPGKQKPANPGKFRRWVFDKMASMRASLEAQRFRSCNG